MQVRSIETPSDAPSTWYLAISAVASTAILAAAWVFVSEFRLCFLESGYPVWLSKFELVRDCDLGSVVLFGDSRSQASFVPERYSSVSSNISFGAATPIELYLVASEALKCEKLPRRVMVSLASVEFTIVQPFLWENGARYGFFSFSDLRRVARAATRLKDPSVGDVPTRFGHGGLVRDAIYGFRFPSIYFNSLVQGRLLGRYGVNERLLGEARRRRGFVPFRPQGEPHKPGREAMHAQFRPLPVQDYFFREFLALARDRGIAVEFVATPITPTTAGLLAPDYRRDFESYLSLLAREYRNFHLFTPAFYAAPWRLFADADHLNLNGAQRFTDGLASCAGSATQHCLPIRADTSED